MTNGALALSPLETGLLNIFHDLYGARGFPSATQVSIARRENTGAGRYVDLESNAELEMDDGYLDLGGRFIQMRGIPHGMMAVVLVKGRRIRQLEIAVYGEVGWDGEERDWSVVKP